MLYHYLDETYKKKNGYWHCVIGGLLVPAELVVDIEIQLNEAISSCNSESEEHPLNKEFKFTSFFETVSDTYKYEVFSKLVDVVFRNDLEILASHAFIEGSVSNKIVDSFGDHQKMIQYLAFVNMSEYLSPLSCTTQIQTVVDMGLNESFKPIYDMYTSIHKTIPSMSSMGFDETHITFKDYRNVPIPLFIESRDSKLIQLSDVIVGLLLASKMENLSPFKSYLYNLMQPIICNIKCHTIEWNKQSA